MSRIKERERHSKKVKKLSPKEGVLFSRRNFLKAGLVLLGAGAAAAIFGPLSESREEYNAKFADTLKKLAGVTPGMTKEQLRLLSYAYERSVRQKNWAPKGDVLGDFIGAAGQRIQIKLRSDGEFLSLIDAPPVPYKEYKKANKLGFAVFPALKYQPQVKDRTLPITGTDKTNVVVAYGDVETTLLNLAKQESTLTKFVDEYFSLSESPINVLHLNFAPRSQFGQIPFIDVGGYGQNEGFSPSNPGGTAVTRSRVDNRIINERSDVIFNLEVLHDNVRKTGRTIEEAIPSTALNELVGVDAIQLERNVLRPAIDESFSSLVGLAASFDPSMQRAFLPPNLPDFVQLLKGEMNRLIQ